MRWLTCLTLIGCAALKELTPTGPVLTWAQRADLGPTGHAGVHYTGPARLPFPVPPLQVWGLAYDVDLTLRTRHPDWDMHEYARVLTPDGPLWLMKDARAADLSQSIVADLDDLDDWLPEVPVPRKRSVVRVDDRSTDTHLDLDLAYENLDGVPVTLTWRSRWPERIQPDRNGNTMGHSQDTVTAALDLSRRAFGEGELTIGGVRQPVVRILGLVPFRVALVQTQAGFSVGALTFTADGDGVRSAHVGGTVQSWSLTPTPTGVELTQHAALRTLRYAFQRASDATLELAAVRVEQYGVAAPAAYVRFLPALPDARRPFEGRFEGAWVLDVGGQPAHATGTATMWWPDDLGPVLELRGEAPGWVADRPLRATVRVTDADATVSIARIP